MDVINMEICSGVKEGDILFSDDSRKPWMFLEVVGYDDFLDAIKVRPKIHPDGEYMLGKASLIVYCSEVDDYEVLDRDDALERVTKDQITEAIKYYVDGFTRVKGAEDKVKVIEREFKRYKDYHNLDFDIDIDEKDFVEGQSSLSLFG